MAIASWVGPPRSYTVGRPRPIQFVVVHYTAGSEGPTSAEAGAVYDKIRTDGVSTHVFADSNSVVREVLDKDQAHAAFFHGNAIGLQLEICGTIQTRAQWLDPTSLATLRLAAKQTAEWCRDHGLAPRRLSVAETRAAWFAPAGQRPKGIVGHVDVTNAFPEDPGNHTDPGKDFPWDVFLGMVAEELGGGGGTTMEEDDGEVRGIVARVPNAVVLAWVDGQLGKVHQNIDDGANVDDWVAAGWVERTMGSLATLGPEVGEARRAWAREQAEAIAAALPVGGGGPGPAPGLSGTFSFSGEGTIASGE